MSLLTFDKVNLKNIVADIFQAEGLSSQESETIAKHLVLANLRGVDSHGVTRIKNYTEKKTNQQRSSEKQL
ncbi:hypothetical protein DT065_04165 [Salicibibacter kimchii]|uniref:Ldh family oxidoreductase n=1 Tax=Salicibibacter kimchii TaxID=2099786 RepID=A0A345BWG1_9BACI|nr:hypothetical protein DT065_04165 [Salicibibacter kimchii]